MLKLILPLLWASPALAQSYADNPIAQTFQAPCSIVIERIDNAPETIEGAGEMAALFGFIVGFDTAAGGLEDGDRTTLVRLREACAADPGKSALEHLQAMAER